MVLQLSHKEGRKEVYQQISNTFDFIGVGVVRIFEGRPKFSELMMNKNSKHQFDDLHFADRWNWDSYANFLCH